MFRNWCFTINNYTQKDIDLLENQELWGYTYCIFGKEIGKKGTDHLQGYMEFKSAKRLTTLKKLHQQAHWEQRKGTKKQAIDYCKKDGQFTEHGTAKDNQGHRTDLENLREDLENGKPMREIVRNYNYQCIRTAEKWIQYCDIKRTTKPTVTWIWGSSGSGKTKLAYEMGENDIYM